MKKYTILGIAFLLSSCLMDFSDNSRIAISCGDGYYPVYKRDKEFACDMIKGQYSTDPTDAIEKLETVRFNSQTEAEANLDMTPEQIRIKQEEAKTAAEAEAARQNDPVNVAKQNYRLYSEVKECIYTSVSMVGTETIDGMRLWDTRHYGTKYYVVILTKDLFSRARDRVCDDITGFAPHNDYYDKYYSTKPLADTELVKEFSRIDLMTSVTDMEAYEKSDRN